MGTFALTLALLNLSLPTVGADSLVLQAMQKELDRSMSKLKNAGDAPLYFLAYRVYDTTTVNIKATDGALVQGKCPRHYCTLGIDLRVGDSHLDNTHKLRGSQRTNDENYFPLEADQWAIRTALWNRTESAFRKAQENYSKARVNKDIESEEEDPADDLSKETVSQYAVKEKNETLDESEWEARLKRASAKFKQFPHLRESSMELVATTTHRYFVNSDGTKIEDDRREYRIDCNAEALCDDGMVVWLYDNIYVPSAGDLPDQARLDNMVNNLGKSVEALRTAPKAEPYAGPAILQARAAAVFFHETFGHRVEGHRQKDNSEGQTFTKKIGFQVMPAFISVVDDPTRQMLGNQRLTGYYRFDDEGVPAQKVVLVNKGILKTFLLSRSPILGFPHSNGHGRCSPTYAPVARQANLIVESSKAVPYKQLREMLLAEVKKQGKPYGLIFDQLSGGFTTTSRSQPQAYELKPLRVTRVFADGKPDQLLRGVNLVGTPLASLECILCTGNDEGTFNGWCGAESGSIPVSASSPSLLIQTIETQRQKIGDEKAPLLPPPPEKSGDKNSIESGDHQ